jgi:hypothetical protein
MKRWLPALTLTAVLTPLAVCRAGNERVPPPAPVCSPANGKANAEPCDTPEDDLPGNEREMNEDLLEILATTKSPDTFMAVVAALLGADSTAEKRYARLAVPVVIRHAERLGILKGIASAEQLTPVQEELLDYLEGATPASAQAVPAGLEIVPPPRPSGLLVRRPRAEPSAPPTAPRTGKRLTRTRTVTPAGLPSPANAAPSAATIPPEAYWPIRLSR